MYSGNAAMGGALVENEQDSPPVVRSRLDFIRYAVHEVPEVKYAVGLAGIAACISVIRGFLPGVSLFAMLPIFAGSIIAMAFLLLLVFAAKPNRNSSAVAGVFLWAVCIFVIIFMGFTITAIAISWPKIWAQLILPERAASVSVGSTIRSGVQNGLHGYVYYENSKVGQMTADGRLTLFSNDPLPAYDAVSVGSVLQAQDGVELRQSPPSGEISPHDMPKLTTLAPGQCVTVTGVGKYSVMVKDPNAASGGWLPVDITQCSKD